MKYGFIRCARWVSVAVLFAIINNVALAGSSVYSVGVYYFPGWVQAPPFAKGPPWDAIEKFPEREPLLGWYKEGTTEVAQKQIFWMGEYNINFVIYDWYWTDKNGPVLTHAVDAYLRVPNKRGVDFSLLWANHTGTPSSLKQFDEIVLYWIEHYFVNKNYYKIDSEPVVFIFSPMQLDVDARRFGMTGGQLIRRAKTIAVDHGLKGIYFVASTQAVADQVEHDLPAASYDALSAYNYHFGLSGALPPNPVSSHSYAELSSGYLESWNWIVRNSTLPYFVPVTAGWNKRPWGGSSDKEHDNSSSTVAEFREHLMSAKAVLDQFPEQTRKTVVICCWNEYGEGSYIEPTLSAKFSYLEQVKKVFAAGR